MRIPKTCAYLLAVIPMLAVGCEASSDRDLGRVVNDGSEDGERASTARLIQLLENGAPIVGEPELTPLRTGETIAVGSESMPLSVYEAQLLPVWELPDGSVSFTSQAGATPLGDAYYLPWRYGEATVMSLPGEALESEAFITPNLDGCSVLVGENAGGRAVVMHLNGDTPSFQAAAETRGDAILDASDLEPDEALVARRSAWRDFTDFADAFYGNAAQGAVDAGIFDEAPERLSPGTYQLTAEGDPLPHTYVNATWGDDGWSFRWGHGDGATALPGAVGRYHDAQADEFFDAQEGNPADWAEADAVSALRTAQNALAGLSNLSEQEQGIRLSEGMQVAEETERIFSRRPMPDSVASERTGLLSRLDELGVEYGATTTESVSEAFADAAEHEGDLAAVLAEGGAVQRGFVYAGRTFLVIGIGVSVYRVITAENQELELARQGAGWGAAVAAGSAAAAGMSWLDIAGPYGWIADGVVGIGAGALAFWGGSNLGEAIYNSVHPDNEDPLPDALRTLQALPPLPPQLYQGLYDGTAYEHGHAGYFERMDIARAPGDTDWSRWAMLNDEGNYRLYAMAEGTDDRLYEFVYNPASGTYEYGHGSLADEIGISGAPADADLSSIAMMHAQGAYRLYAKSKSSPLRVHQFVYRASTQSFVYGWGGAIPSIDVTMFPQGTDFSGWGMLWDDSAYHIYAFSNASHDAVAQGTYNYASQDYEYQDTIDISGYPGDADTSDFAMLHSGDYYHLYMMRLP